MRGLILCGLLTLNTQAAPITYNFDLPGVTGSITTDGALGFITAADVLAWEFGTDLTGGDSQPRQNPFLALNGLIATSQSLALTNPGGLEMQDYGSGLSWPATGAIGIGTFAPGQLVAYPDDWGNHYFPAMGRHDDPGRFSDVAGAALCDRQRA